MDMKTVKVPFRGKGRKINYKAEIVDLSMTPVQFLNVYSVFIDDEELQELIGEHFTILHNHSQTLQPCFNIISPGNVEEQNLKKQIAQQILNDPAQ
jgi:hypothetical protein